MDANKERERELKEEERRKKQKLDDERRAREAVQPWHGYPV